MKASVRSVKDMNPDEARDILTKQFKSPKELGGKEQAGEAKELQVWVRGERMAIRGYGWNVDGQGLSFIEVEFSREELAEVITQALKDEFLQIAGIGDLADVKKGLELSTKALMTAMQRMVPS